MQERGLRQTTKTNNVAPLGYREKPELTFIKSKASRP